MVALADFIRCHPRRSPFGLAEAVQIFFRKICGKGDSSLKPAFTPRRDESAVLACMAMWAIPNKTCLKALLTA
jgi:hypothetical protein